MARDVLSQGEIDSLISALTSGQLVEEEKKDLSGYQPYDFRRPTKFSKEQLRTLQIIHENYARILGNFLSAYLRVPVKLNVVSVSQVTYEEFIFSLPVPTLMTIFNMSPELGIAMLETNPQFVFTLIDLSFGGEGSAPSRIRDFTEIEMTVMRQICEKLLHNLSYVWKGLAELDPVIESMDSNPQFNQVIASNEAVAMVTFAVQIQDNKSFINFCFPYLTLERVISNLTAQNWFNQFQHAAIKPLPGQIEKMIGEAEVEVTAVLGRTTITLEEFLQFQPGDVLQLNRNEGEPIEVCVEKETVFMGQPGLIGQNLAVQISGWYREKEEKET